MIMQEIWKDVKGYEGLYQVSNYGRLKSFKVDSKGKILKLTNQYGDYFAVVLQGKGVPRRSARMHRLVAEAFLPNPDNLPEVNHIDGDKQNNKVDNLEWISHSKNIIHSMTELHSHQIEKMVNFNKHIRPKPIIQMDMTGKVLAEFETATMASRQTGVCARNILQVANKAPYRKSAGGYLWAFKRGVI